MVIRNFVSRFIFSLSLKIIFIRVPVRTRMGSRMIGIRFLSAGRYNGDDFMFPNRFRIDTRIRTYFLVFVIQDLSGILRID